MLVLPYVPNSPKVVIFTGTIAADTTTFSNMLLTQYFSNYCNRGSNCIIRRGI